MDYINILTKRLVLRPWHEDDLPVLFIWRNSETYREFCSNRKKEITFEQFHIEFLNDLKKDRTDQFMVCRNKDAQSVGTIFLYNLNTHHRNAFVTIFIEDQFHKYGFGPEAFGHYVQNMMKKYGLHKICTEVYSHNTNIPSMLLRAGFIPEGLFREHRITDQGDWLDIHRYSLFEDNLQQLNEYVLKLYS